MESEEAYKWMLQAHCRSAAPSEFFPSDGLGVESAQKVCAKCPVKVDCLEYALTNRIEHGVWGGASERERRRILRHRRDMEMPPVVSRAPLPSNYNPMPVAETQHPDIEY